MENRTAEERAAHLERLLEQIYVVARGSDCAGLGSAAILSAVVGSFDSLKTKLATAQATADRYEEELEDLRDYTNLGAFNQLRSAAEHWCLQAIEKDATLRAVKTRLEKLSAALSEGSVRDALVVLARKIEDAL